MRVLRLITHNIYRLYKILRELCSLAVRCHHYYPFWKFKFYSLYYLSIKLYRSGKFIPDEIIHFGFFTKKYTRKEISRYISRNKLFSIQAAINPVTWSSVLEDKSVFYRYCDCLGIPVPKLYAIFFRTSPGWSHENEILANKKEWLEFFSTQLPENFIIKPSNGVYGQGFYALTRSKGHFLEASGSTYTPGELYDKLISHAGYKNFVIQERLKNHPDIADLSGSEYLQTVRIVTSISKGKGYKQITQTMKIIQGDNYFDNFDSGKTGNLISRIEPNDGVLRPAITFNKGNVGCKIVKNRSENGSLIKGFRLPYWKESCELAKKAAIKFLPVQTVGWDIAITKNGPCLIEGNFWWDGPPIDENGCMEDIMSYLS